MTHRKQRASAQPLATSPLRRLGLNRDGYDRVLQELAAAGTGEPRIDPIVERLKQCPEAFTAGEMIGKMFDALKYREDEAERDERYLPPAGVVLPLV